MDILKSLLENTAMTQKIQFIILCKGYLVMLETFSLKLISFCTFLVSVFTNAERPSMMHHFLYCLNYPISRLGWETQSNYRNIVDHFFKILKNAVSKIITFNEINFCTFKYLYLSSKKVINVELFEFICGFHEF